MATKHCETCLSVQGSETGVSKFCERWEGTLEDGNLGGKKNVLNSHYCSDSFAGGWIYHNLE